MAILLLYGVLMMVPPLGVAFVAFLTWGAVVLAWAAVKRVGCLFAKPQRRPCYWCQRTTCSWAEPVPPLPAAIIHREYSRWN